MLIGVELVRSLIVGIDPGITTGVAILDNDGALVDIWSKRDASRAEIIRHITEFGHPVVIATDVVRPPRNVEKISTKFGSQLYAPEYRMSVAEKHRLTKNYIKKIKYEERLSGHENDALAATLKAYRHYKNLFNRIDHVLSKRRVKPEFKDIVSLLLRNESENISNAIELLGERRRKREMRKRKRGAHGKKKNKKKGGKKK